MAAIGVPVQPPQLSPDGRFYWDGARWVPMPGASAAPLAPTKPLPNRLAGGLVTAGGTIAVVGCFLPWISASAFIGTVTRDGISSPDGQILAGVAAISALLGVLMLARRVSLVVPLFLALTAAGAMWILAVDYQDLNSRVQGVGSTSGVIAEIGPGIYAAALGVIIWAIGAVAGLYRHPAPKPVVSFGPYAPAADSRVAQLHGLAERRDSGLLTDEEFAAERAKLLGT
jgi:hypothetical protein